MTFKCLFCLGCEVGGWQAQKGDACMVHSWAHDAQESLPQVRRAFVTGTCPEQEPPREISKRYERKITLCQDSVQAVTEARDSLPER